MLTRCSLCANPPRNIPTSQYVNLRHLYTARDMLVNWSQLGIVCCDVLVIGYRGRPLAARSSSMGGAGSLSFSSSVARPKPQTA
jgi:hypothetical protein